MLSFVSSYFCYCCCCSVKIINSFNLLRSFYLHYLKWNALTARFVHNLVCVCAIHLSLISVHECHWLEDIDAMRTNTNALHKWRTPRWNLILLTATTGSFGKLKEKPSSKSSI